MTFGWKTETILAFVLLASFGIWALSVLAPHLFQLHHRPLRQALETRRLRRQEKRSFTFRQAFKGVRGLGGGTDLFTDPCCNANKNNIPYGIFNTSIPCVGGTIDTTEIPSLTWVRTKLETITVNVCQHRQVREIGEDFDKEGRLLRLMRCQRCGLIMREYLPM